MFTFFRKQLQNKALRGLSKDPFFYFGLMSFVLFGLLFFSSNSLAEPSYGNGGDTVFFNAFFTKVDHINNDSPFFSQNKQQALETPDLKIVQDNAVSAVATPSVLTAQTLGDVFGGVSQESRKEVIDYTVVPGDTIASLAEQFAISKKTIAWANNISENAPLKIGQTLTILPFSGVSHVVKNGDTLSQIAKTYKADSATIIADNSLSGEGDIFIGDILVIRDGVLPPIPVPSIASVPIADNFFIFPLLRFKVTQGRHYYNAVDISSLDGIGSPVYAAAAGIVQRAGYDRTGGNRVTILHSNGVATYYGHLRAILVKPGEVVYMGQQIGTEGETGKATGPHVHFEVIGADNFIAARFGVGAIVDTAKH